MKGRERRRAPLELIVFDFDGTLCDSAGVKTNAFYDLYLEDCGPVFAASVKKHHLANVGVSRYDKIRYVETEMLGNDPSDDEVERIAARYAKLVEDAVVDAPLFDGVSGFLSAVPTGVRCVVASATPTAELRRIVERKHLSAYFMAIEGSPRSKAEIVADWISAFAVDPGSVVVVGDQPSDADAARTTGSDGIMITPPAAWVAPYAACRHLHRGRHRTGRLDDSH